MRLPRTGSRRNVRPHARHGNAAGRRRGRARRRSPGVRRDADTAHDQRLRQRSRRGLFAAGGDRRSGRSARQRRVWAAATTANTIVLATQRYALFRTPAVATAAPQSRRTLPYGAVSGRRCRRGVGAPDAVAETERNNIGALRLSSRDAASEPRRQGDLMLSASFDPPSPASTPSPVADCSGGTAEP